MKFNLLAIGQQFEYQGKTYIKSTPLIAHQVDNGEQRLIPRSAMVTVTGAAGTPPVSENKSISEQELQQAFNQFETALEKNFEGNTTLARALAEAKQHFFQQLGITPAIQPTDKDYSSSK